MVALSLPPAVIKIDPTQLKLTKRLGAAISGKSGVAIGALAAAWHPCLGLSAARRINRAYSRDCATRRVDELGSPLKNLA